MYLRPALKKLLEKHGNMLAVARELDVSVAVVSQVMRGVYPHMKSLKDHLAKRANDALKRRPTGHKPQPQTDRQKVWQCMRIMRMFSLRQLEMTSGVNYAAVRIYCRRLRNAGYIRLQKKHGNKAGEFAAYRLVRNTGPLPPSVKRDGTVVDQNRRGGTRP